MLNTSNLKCCSFFIIGLLLTTLAPAQKNYLPGYFIDLKGDSVQGLIDYRNWQKNPEQVHFKKETGSEEVILNPLSIREFGVQKEKYISAIVNTETSPSQLNRLLAYPDLRLEKDTVFLRALFRGEKDLYMLHSQDGKDDFFIRSDADYQLLVYKKYLKFLETGQVVAENNTYIGQLMLYLNRCPDLKTQFENSHYDQRSLEKLYNRYYDCVSLKPEYRYLKERLKLEIGILAGLSYSNLKVISNTNPELAKADYTKSVNFTAGMFFDLIRPRNQGRWSLCNELIFTRYDFTGDYDEYYSPEYYINTDLHISCSQFKINNMLRFRYPVKKFLCYANLGISNGLTAVEHNQKIRYTKVYVDERTVKSKAFSAVRLHEQSLLLGVGSRYKGFGFELRDEIGNGFSNLERTSTVINRVYALATYRF